MSFLNDLFADLVTKRLWPVAVVLVAAAIAVPVLLTKDAPQDPRAIAEARDTATRAAQESAAVQPVVSLAPAGTKTKAQVRGLHAKDPFRAQKSAKAASDQVSVGSGSSGGGSQPSSGGGGGTTTPKTTEPPAAPPKTYTTYDVDLRFGEAGDQKTHHNVTRLTPLPNSDDPILVYLGLMSDGKTAVFLVSADATPQGDATCKPKKSVCSYVYLHEGDTEFFDVSAGAAGLVQYELKVVDITAKKTTSQAAAARAYARESEAGREILRAELDSVGALRYSHVTGTISLAKKPAKTSAKKPAKR